MFHTNEGHAGFLGLERMRRSITEDGLSFAEAVEANRAGAIFTTHTPVPAGIDLFDRELMDKYFSGWARECGVSMDDLMALGHRAGDHKDDPFNMAVMGLRLAGRSNAVAKLHGEVSREMFSDLWPDVPDDEVPIGSVTNGVHAGTWVAPEISDLLAKYVLPSWDDADPERWARVVDAADDELWRAKEQGRERLVAFVRQRLKTAGPRGRRVVVRRGLDRRGARPQGAHDRLRPSLRHLQAGEPAAVPTRAPASAAAVVASGRCSSSSPARPTPPTTPARR